MDCVYKKREKAIDRMMAPIDHVKRRQITTMPPPGQALPTLWPIQDAVRGFKPTRGYHSLPA